MKQITALRIQYAKQLNGIIKNAGDPGNLKPIYNNPDTLQQWAKGFYNDCLNLCTDDDTRKDFTTWTPEPTADNLDIIISNVITLETLEPEPDYTKFDIFTDPEKAIASLLQCDKQSADTLKRVRKEYTNAAFTAGELNTDDVATDPTGNAANNEGTANVLPLVPITAADCVNYPSVSYILDGLIEAETITLFSGREKIGKTYVLMDLALHMAAELPWLDLHTMEDVRGNVLWLDFDMNRNTTMRRINQITNGIEESWNVRKPDLFKNFGMMDGQLFRESGYKDSFQFFSRSDAVNGLREYLIANNVKVCFIDNLVQIEGDAEENSSNDIQKVFSGLKQLRDETHAAFILIHHTTKDGFRGRGSSAIFGETDLNLQLEPCTNPDQLILKTDGARNAAKSDIGMMKHWDFRLDDDGFSPLTDDHGHFIYNFKLTRIETDGLETENTAKAKGRNAATMSENITKIVKFFQDNGNQPTTKTALTKVLKGGKDDRLKSVDNAYNEGILVMNTAGQYSLKQ